MEPSITKTRDDQQAARNIKRGKVTTSCLTFNFQHLIIKEKYQSSVVSRRLAHRIWGYKDDNP